VVGFLETATSLDLDDHAECTMLGAYDQRNTVVLVLVMSTNTASEKHATYGIYATLSNTCIPSCGICSLDGVNQRLQTVFAPPLSLSAHAYGICSRLRHFLQR